MNQTENIEAQLREQGFYVSTTVGCSMFPMLRNRRDRVVVLPVGLERLSKYDLPPYRRPDGKDILHFDLVSESHPQGIDVDLNAEDGQNQLVTVFSCLLQKLLISKVVLQLKIEASYTRALFKDVCTEYIKNLNSELDSVYEQMISEQLV